jgi:GNAT superfamily N-acetyltransferase
MEWTNGDYVLSDDPRRINLDEVMALLATTYWANDRPREVMEKAMRHSVCLGLLHDSRLAGFARGVTDQATFTWVCDVIVHPDHRGRGLGKWMMERFFEHSDLQTTSYHLRTEDAHGLYERFGFRRVEAMRRSTKW